MTSLSFKFSKTTRKPTNSNIPEEKIIETEETELEITGERVFISGFDSKGVKDVGGNVKEEKIEFIIPALQNTIRLIPTTATTTSTTISTTVIAAASGESSTTTTNGAAAIIDLEAEAAKRALLDDAQRLLDNVKDVLTTDNSAIPVQLGKEEKLEIATITADDADYDSISVDVFGKALLRGMGWKEGDAIGRSGKKSTAPIVTAPRPKGLGLGAEAKPPPGASSTPANSTAASSSNAEELVLKIGSYVKRTDAKTDKERYGKVIGWDEDNACVVVQMAIGRSTARISQHKIQVVTYKEFEKSGKCINHSEYQEYKEIEEKKHGKRTEIPAAEELFKLDEDKRDRKKSSRKDDDNRRDRNGRDASSPSTSSRSSSSKKKDRKRSRSPSSKKDRRRSKSPASISKSRKRSRSRSPISSKLPIRTWLRPDLRVRIVDEKYRRGKFFKTKAVVLDVKSADLCSCMADDGRTILDDLNEDMLETVVPKGNGAAVMIVRGSNAGKIGTVLERDSRSYSAVVQLSESIKTISFDDICEYVGDMADE